MHPRQMPRYPLFRYTQRSASDDATQDETRRSIENVVCPCFGFFEVAPRVLRQEQALLDERLRGALDRGGVLRAAAVALFERETGIVARAALGLGRGKGTRAAVAVAELGFGERRLV